MKRQIICIFFTALAFLLPEAAADVPVFSRIRLKNDSSGRDAAFLRETVRQLDRLRRIAGKKLPEGNLLVVTGRRDFFYDGKILMLPGNASLWETSPRLQRKITGVLAAFRFGLEIPSDPPELAPWICAGLDDAVAVAVTRGKYISGNRSFPMLAAWQNLNGTLPRADALCRLDFADDTASGILAAEHARLLLEIFAANGRITELFAGSLAGEKPDFWLKWYASADDAAKHIADDAAKLLWNRYSPLPPEQAEKEIAELKIFFIPEYLPAGKPSGNIISADIKQLASQLAIAGEDAAGIRKNCAAPWREFSSRLAPAENIICSKISAIIADPENGAALPEKFTAAVNELLTALEFRKKAEIFFRDTLDRHAPPAVRLAIPLNDCTYSGMISGTPAEKFFLQTLDRYTR